VRPAPRAGVPALGDKGPLAPLDPSFLTLAGQPTLLTMPFRLHRPWLLGWGLTLLGLAGPLAGGAAPPDAGTLWAELPARFRVVLGGDPLTGGIAGSLELSASGDAFGGRLTSLVGLGSLTGPDPVGLDRVRLAYQRGTARCEIGDVSVRLSDLLSLYTRGGAVSVDEDHYDFAFLGGWSGEEARAGGLLAVGPEEANLGLAYAERRDDVDREAAWSLAAVVEPLADWWIHLEGALGLVGPLTSRSFLVRTKVDSGGYGLTGEAFSIGTHFPGTRQDEAGVALSQSLREEKVALGASLRHIWDNVDGDPLLPTTIQDDLTVDLSLTPAKGWPTASARLDFAFRRDTTLVLTDEVERSLSFSLFKTDGRVPFSISGRCEDAVDHVAGTHLSTWVWKEGAGLSLDEAEVYLEVSQSREVDLVAEATVQQGTDISVRFRSRKTLHQMSLSLGTYGGGLRLSGNADVKIEDDLHVLFNLALGHDEATPGATLLRLGVTFDVRFGLPVPFLITKGRVEGRVFFDQDGDLLLGEAEAGAAGVEVVVGTARVRTDDRGVFRSPALPPGTYAVLVVPGPTAIPSAGAAREVEVVAGEEAWLELPLLPVPPAPSPASPTPQVEPAPEAPRATSSPPRAAFSFSPLEPRVGEPVRLDASASADPDGIIVAYAWTFDGDGQTDATGVTTERAFATGGPHVVTLTVTDAGGATALASRTIEVAAPRPGTAFRPPTADFTYAPERPHTGETVRFDASGTTDLDGEIVSYAWTFDGEAVDAAGATTDHVFLTAGEHTATLTVTDNDGVSDTMTATIEVE